MLVIPRSSNKLSPVFCLIDVFNQKIKFTTCIGDNLCIKGELIKDIAQH